MCETLNVMITDKALEAMDAKKVTLVVLLDLSKAFNSIDHVTLLAKLQALGASRASLDWFKSYLSEQLQCVRIGAETSSLQGISHGVPQGSILGPALFTIYLNNIPSTVNSRLADTSLLRTPRYYGQQQNTRRKLQTFE